MNKCRIKQCSIVAVTVLTASAALSAGIANISAFADDASVLPERYEAVSSLREAGSANGWSVGSFTDDTLSADIDGAAGDYQYYTTQNQSGFKYAAADGAFAFAPNEHAFTVPDSADFANLPRETLETTKYSMVLQNDAEKDMALVYTAERGGVLYFQDLAQVAPLCWDDRESAGVYGEYRILLESEGVLTQVYPAEGSHELYAANAASTTSAWVNSSVEVKQGDKLIFRSDKADSTIFSSPVVSYTEFEEVYELKNFWKYQQINDANYFEPVYRNEKTDDWLRFPNLETRKTEWDIPQRGDVQMKSSFYWTGDYNYMGMFGGMYVHASGNGADVGTGDVAYVFKVPHNGYIDIELALVGNWAAGDFEIVYEGETLDSCTLNGDTIFKLGDTLSAKAVKVTAGTEIYFVQKTASGGSLKTDMNPVITYVEAPYQLDKTTLVIDSDAEDTLTLQLNPGYELDAADVKWAAATEGIVELVPDGNTVTVKGLAGGQTVITAKVGEYSAVSCEVTVTAVLKNEFTVDPVSLSIKKGEAGTIVVTVSDKITADALSVAVEDDTVATAAIEGNAITVNGLKKGSTNLYIMAEGSKSVTVEITVSEDTGSSNQPSDPSDPSDPANPSNPSGSETPGKDNEVSISCGSSVSMTLGGLTVALGGAAVAMLRRKK